MTATSGLSGRGMQQSDEQWKLRGMLLSAAMAGLIADFQPPGATSALDVGCQSGLLVDALATMTSLNWQGIDPAIEGSGLRSPGGAVLAHGWADQLNYADESFDVLLLANVFEHILPQRRTASLMEMARVLRPGGIVVGQIPNPYFFIESHSRLPLMGWLPLRAQKVYWRIAPVPWPHDFYVVTLRHIRRQAAQAGLSVAHTRRFNYPLDVIPTSVQWVARGLRPIMAFFPWSWQFVLAKPAIAARDQGGAPPDEDPDRRRGHAGS